MVWTEKVADVWKMMKDGHDADETPGIYLKSKTVACSDLRSVPARE